MSTTPHSPGDRVRVEMTKWVDSPHWHHDAVFLGTDEHGDWIGARTGTRMQRPGRDMVAECDFVMLAPVSGAGPGTGLDRGWVATFNQPGNGIQTYVDMTTAPRWDGAVLRAVDLDLDVVRTWSGFVWVDDEDEFEEHQVSLDYPAEVIALARYSADTVLDAVLEERAPFDGVSARWFAALDALAH